MTSRTVPLSQIACVIRSKNAKPYRLTLDVLFEERRVFELVKASNALTPATVATAYGVPLETITSWYVYEAGMAFKFTLKRPLIQGSFGDADLYGAQQHGHPMAAEPQVRLLAMARAARQVQDGGQRHPGQSGEQDEQRRADEGARG